MKLIGEGVYNLNTLKEIKVTDSFLDMDQDVIACQDVQPLDNCTTKHYMDSLLDECGCIPWNISPACNDPMTLNIPYPHS